jgi:hypothetical protein
MVLLTPAQPPNNGMHPTADTTILIFDNRMGRRVIPGVRFLQWSQRMFYDRDD